MGAITSAVGSVLPVLTGAAGIINTVKGVANAFENIGNSSQKQDDLALKQLQQTQKLQAQQAADKAALDAQQNAAQADADAENRRQALLRAVAKQRAAYGAEGIDLNSGSPQAVLLGLYNSADAEQAQADQISNLRDQALNLGVDQQNSLNLLQATQLAQRNSLSRLF